jgi:hypothetical protein
VPYVWVWLCPLCGVELRDEPKEYYKREGNTTCKNNHSPMQMKHKKRKLYPGYGGLSPLMLGEYYQTTRGKKQWLGRRQT